MAWQVLGLFGLYDDDRSGSLEYYEFVEKMLDEGLGNAKSELKGMLAEVIPIPVNKRMTLKETRRASVGTIKKMFNKFDVNHSGSIDVRELRFFLEKMGVHASTDQAPTADPPGLNHGPGLTPGHDPVADRVADGAT